MGIQTPVTLQQQYSLAYRENEYEVIPAALHNGVGLLPWSPTAAGFLTGKYDRQSARQTNGRLSGDNPMIQYQARQLLTDEARWATLEAVKQVAAQIGATPSQVALSWVGHQPAVTAPIVGARTLAQLKENLGAADLVLPVELSQKLTDISAPVPQDYPYGRFGVLQRERYIDSSEQALREL